MMTMESSSGRGVGGGETGNMKSGGSGGGEKMFRPSPLRRRRYSRGLIAAGGRPGGGGDAGAVPRQGDETNDNTAPSAAAVGGGVGGANPHPGGSGSSSNGPDGGIGGGDSAAGPASSASPNTPPALPALPKPCYSGRLALACVENALQMGVITKFSLCPQGKARKNLVIKTKSARERKQWKDATSTKHVSGGVGAQHDLAQELFLQNPPYRGTGGEGSVAMEEEYSSGDDEDFDGSIVDDDESVATSNNSSNNSAANKNNPLHSAMNDSRHKEPFFVPTGPDAASMGLQGGQVPGMTAGKLPFNYRKIRYFDVVTASDRAVARQFLQSEIVNAKKLRSKALSNHLKKAQLRERERMEREAAASLEKTKIPNMDSLEGGGSDAVDLQAEQTALATALSRFPHELTPVMSAALLIESLAMNHHESIEGMAKCYDGIVSAGTALLDLANDRDGGANTPGGGGGAGGKTKLTASEIMGALAPLLITSLEQSSGEAIVALARLRNYCGTRRYQRRFVQRVAPFLVRPPNAAMWCLRHQSDIEPIIAAVEMILDNASEVFSAGWYERGRNMLKDTRRAETLRTAASQLRRLNSPSPTDGGLLVGLSSTPGSAHHRRSLGVGMGSGKGKDGASITDDNSLAEWEVDAVDKRIRQSILDVFSRDWSRISTLNLSPREAETPFGSRGRRGISTAKSKEWDRRGGGGDDVSAGASAVSPGGVSASSSLVSAGPMASSSLTKSPRSTSKLPLSPRSSAVLATPSQMPSADLLESTFGPSFSSQNVLDDREDSGRPASPTEHLQPTAPLSPGRNTAKSVPTTPKTPPAHYHEIRPSDSDRMSMPNFHEQQQQPPQHSSPGRAGASGISAPHSPTHSVGNASTSTMGTFRSTASPSNQSISSNRDQYRALTSTAAERKRTVAACRALRAQITQFEDAFIQMHGRAPKGAAERAPLASTYMQYREWKRAIRADAACRIQALCRGARIRLMLMRSDDPRVARFVGKRIGGMLKSPLASPKPLKDLSIPLDMGGDDIESSMTRTRLETRTTGQRGADDGVEVEMIPVPSSVSPSWRNRQQQQQQHQQQQQQQRGSQQQQPSSGGSSHVASHGHKSRRSSSLPDVSVMSLAELQQRKRELKQQLKLYDMNFHQQHGRMPEKREKEPIRHLYESYNAYKNQISVIEKGEVQPGPGTAAFRGVTEAAAAAAAEISPKNVSPTYNSGNTSPIQGNFKRSSSGGMSSADSMDVSQEDSATTNTAMNSASEVASQDLAALKAEKATLHQMLRSYEKDFFKQHKRQVSSFADIRPVASQYRRYKEIKKAIAQKSSGG